MLFDFKLQSITFLYSLIFDFILLPVDFNKLCDVGAYSSKRDPIHEKLRGNILWPWSWSRVHGLDLESPVLGLDIGLDVLELALAYWP